MIPRLAASADEVAGPPNFFNRLVEVGFTGDIETGQATRTVFSTDNSIYQVRPAGVLFPRTAEDMQVVARVIAEPPFARITVTPRGGGTGTNGQSLTSGVVLDCSRYMTRIMEIDPVRRVARVQAGVVKDQLNRALLPYGLFFAPELSTSNRATIGGMISTDASGQGSCLYGKTSNHVLGLRVVLSDGSDFWSRPLDAEALARAKALVGRVGDIHRTVEAIARDRKSEIASIFPKLNRYMTGYDLAHILRDDGRFDLNAVICGSEGTLAMIAEAELELLPIPKYSALINIRYGDFNAALEHARVLGSLQVASVETIDEKVLTLARGDSGWPAIARFFPDDGSRRANGINIVEIVADDPDVLAGRLFVGTPMAHVEASANAALGLILLVGVPVTIALGTMGFMLARSIALPIPVLASAMNRIAADDFATEVPYTGYANEIGAMARAVEVFRENGLRVSQMTQEEAARLIADQRNRQTMMIELRKAFGEVVDAAVAGDFSRQVSVEFPDAELNDLANSVNRLVSTFDRSMREIGAVLEALANTNLTVRMNGDYEGAFAKLKGDVNAVADRLTDVIRRLRLNVRQRACGAGAGRRGSSERASDVRSRCSSTHTGDRRDTGPLRQRGWRYGLLLRVGEEHCPHAVRPHGAKEAPVRELAPDLHLGKDARHQVPRRHLGDGRSQRAGPRSVRAGGEDAYDLCADVTPVEQGGRNRRPPLRCLRDRAHAD